jgi:hypothetical protein
VTPKDSSFSCPILLKHDAGHQVRISNTLKKKEGLNSDDQQFHQFSKANNNLRPQPIEQNYP